MPEGHKTHFLAREHSGYFAGQVLKVTSPQGRFRGDARKVSGKHFEHCEALGKHLFYRFENELMIHVHLGRYGKYRSHDVPVPKPVGQVRMRMVGDEHALDLTGPTTCRVIDSSVYQQVVAKLGPDPLAGGRKAEVWKRLSTSNKPIAGLLLDQSLVAGIGNIFRAELLFEIKLDPRTPGSCLDRQDFDRLWRSLGKMMRTGLKYGKIVTVTAKEAGAPLASLEGGARFRVYGKDDCPHCGAAIAAENIGGRKLYWCKHCQHTRQQTTGPNTPLFARS